MYVRRKPEQDRRKTTIKDYPFIGRKLNPEVPGDRQLALSQTQVALADIEASLMHDRLKAGMAGYHDDKEGGTGYALPVPGMDAAQPGLHY